jgi:hypothetical protein
MPRLRSVLAATCLVTGLTAFGTVGPAGVPTPASDAATLLRLECELGRAAVRRDLAPARRLYAADFTSVDPFGEPADRERELQAAAGADGPVFTSFAVSGVRSRVYGNAAVTVGRSHVTGTYKGQDLSGAYQWTDTWVRRGGGWQLVAAQVTKVTNPATPVPADQCAPQ